ncbi:hypothetical protein [Lentzea sp. NBRC 102530]|uniref:hypothetical protein n=1 Tax=Lentzea sp. NBRC 102530 TaxID=3032201 RepID=UPI0025523B68|nr:hypothetical protein [Lentzea sp. NBRC 102530]
MLAPYLEEAVRQLRAAFPKGVRVGDDDFDPLMVVLWDQLAEENFGLVVEEFTGVNRHVAAARYSEEAEQNRRRLEGRAMEIKALLIEHGWDPEED